MKVLILKGLPASGKTTFAKKLVSGDIRSMGNDWIRINKDDLRTMLHNGKWHKLTEPFIVHARDHLLLLALKQGHNVVVDDTNLNPVHELEINKLIKKFVGSYNKPVDVKTKFFDIELEEAIKRDLSRPVSVGKDVIVKMYNEYLKPPTDVYVPPEGKPEAIVVDIDGTLAHMTGRSPFEWHRVHEDKMDDIVANLVRVFFDKGYKVLIVSGRDAGCYDVTKQWLDNWAIPYELIYMRPANDNRDDRIVKREIFEKYIRNFYDVEFVLDDRNKVVEMWRDLGLKVLQVADGNF